MRAAAPDRAPYHAPGGGSTLRPAAIPRYAEGAFLTQQRPCKRALVPRDGPAVTTALEGGADARTDAGLATHALAHHRLCRAPAWRPRSGVTLGGRPGRAH